MTIPKKADPDPFVVPTMSETHSDYRDLLDRQAAVLDRQATLKTERRRLETEIAGDKSPRLRPGVAELLGEDKSPMTARRDRLAAIRTELQDVDAALEIITRRINVAKGAASVAVCDAVRAEYGRRVSVLATALVAAAEARETLAELTDDLDADGVAWTRLGVFVPTFLGDRRDGHVARFVREAREAGYVD